MRLRNTILQYQFFHRLNSLDAEVPAHIYWLRNKNNTITASLARRFKKENAIFNMLGNDLVQLSKKQKRDMIICELEARSRDMNNVGSTITFDTNLKLRACFQADVVTNRNSRILINRWLCGNVANHQICKKCQAPASRIHVIQCTGLETSLMNIDPDFKLCPSSRSNALDQAFQFLYHNPNSASYEVIANCIKKVYMECLGYQQAENGYWNSETTEVPPLHNRRGNARETTVVPLVPVRRRKPIRISNNYSLASRAPDPLSYLNLRPQHHQLQTLPQLREPDVDARQLLPRLPELDDMATNHRREPTRQQLPPFQTLLNTVERRERQHLSRRPDHINNRIHMRTRRDGFIWTYEYMPHMQYYQDPP